MDKINIKAYGKINLSLDVVGKKENGYHLVDMILHSVGIYDVLCIEKIQGSKIVIECDKDYIPTDEKNIIYKAASKFFEKTGINSGIKISLTKNIPMEAGMGGGSADAAGTLIGLNKIFDVGLNSDELKSMGLTLGADVPFCIEGGCARAQGIGEILTNLPALPMNMLVIKPFEGISTIAAYKAIDINNLTNKPDNDRLIEAMRNKDIDNMIKCMGNVFYDISSDMVPKIKFAVETLSLQSGCKKAMMSGSGSTVFGIFQCEDTMELTAKLFDGRGYDVFCTSTCDKGICIE